MFFAVVGPSTEARDQRGKIRRKASATAQINRKDFNLVWTGTHEGGGDSLIGDEVAIVLEIDMIRGK